VFWLAAGLGCVTLATLMLEVLDTRLLSVLAWYHLSFLAISVAMLGMSAGAVLVYAAGVRVTAAMLPGAAVALAIGIVGSHLASLAIPFPPVRAVLPADIASLAVATTALTIPFVVSGVVVTLALTRASVPIGPMYGADLIGAAAGCLAVMGALNVTDLSSVAFLIAAVAGLASWCFARAFGSAGRSGLTVAFVCVSVAWINAHVDHRLGVQYPKNRSVWALLDTVQYSIWNSHSYVIVRRPEAARAWMWGPGTHAPDVPAVVSWSMIDGEAGTPFTKWDGDASTLSWVTYDVTSVAYALRHGRIGIIGVGGGRDVLTAIGTGNTDITGIEINRSFLDLLRGPFRDFAGIAGRPGVTLIHDEARSHLARSQSSFDVLQMSLIDTWASTGAGAFTLSENGLYTREAWAVFLRSLAPRGVLSVSRWYAPGAISETTRLLSLAVASSIDRGDPDPAARIIVATAGRIATLLISREPFSAADRATLESAAERAGFHVELSPWKPSGDPRLAAVVSSRSLEDLDRATADANFNFSPPSDARPFFFNILKLGAALRGVRAPAGGVVEGNLVATSALFALLLVIVLLVVAILGWPLLATGIPVAASSVFRWGVFYFALIGFGFMCVQIAMLQRFSVYLGHPTYTFSTVLFLMIVAAGTGAFASGSRRFTSHWDLLLIPVSLGFVIATEAVLMPVVVHATQAASLTGRTLVVAAFIVPVSFLLGLCFPIGMTLVGRRSSQIAAWMWGVNGACGVLASIVAIMVSIWWGIQTNLFIAAGLYLLLLVPMRGLQGAR
jgi:hypothetical protein